VYEAIVAQARRPGFYMSGGVPDSVDGRYDMIVLHADAVMVHLQAGSGEDRAFAQELIEELFRDMDRSLREMGVGDMGVGKRVKKMATVYYGRANAYAEARTGGQDVLAAALLRNVYAGDEAKAGCARDLAAYAMELHAAITNVSHDAIRAGRLEWPAVSLPQSTTG
jgi:cytochrome b pre-mRNA-processing protein 3